MAGLLPLQPVMQHASFFRVSLRRKCPSDWSPSRLLPPSCKSLKRLSVCLSPPDSASGLIPAGWRSQTGGAVRLSVAASTVTSQSINNRVLSCAAARLWEEHRGLCQIGDWQPGLLRFFCWIKTCSYRSGNARLIWCEWKASHATGSVCPDMCERCAALSKAVWFDGLWSHSLWLLPPQRNTS